MGGLSCPTVLQVQVDLCEEKLLPEDQLKAPHFFNDCQIRVRSPSAMSIGFGSGCNQFKVPANGQNINSRMPLVQPFAVRLLVPDAAFIAARAAAAIATGHGLMGPMDPMNLIAMG